MYQDFYHMMFGYDNEYGTINYSEITFAWLYDTGWYDIDWNETQDIRFGYNKGCDFIETPCIVGGVSQFTEF